ncbi:putative 5-3 exonuclease, partial [Syncephalis plumigaleata]
DHLYIDMNTILHKTCYESKFLANIPEKLIFQSIFHYLDKLVSILKPTKRLYIVIDGVPPRAKMAFQRVKRTRFDLILEKVIEERPQLRRVDNMDNVMRSLAPGSEFMERMASHLRYFIHLKISTDVNWRQLDVIFSDDRVPGEGEYKIAQYIYQCKSEDHVSSSIRHCIYANDSDLLIIGLATHEHNVMVLDDVSYELSTGQST